MSPLTEAVAMPCLLFTVVLAGAIRPGGEVTMAPPTLGSLVTAMAMMGLLVKSGALAPERLMSASRSQLQNANGLTVLVALFAASAQVVTLVIPDAGVPELLGWVVMVSLLLQAFAIAPDRDRLLRGLTITFGAAFVLKFVVLAAISSPAQGRLARALQLLFEGVTLGAVTQRPAHPLDGYLAFATLVLYLAGLAWLPRASWHMVRTQADSSSGRRLLP